MISAFAGEPNARAKQNYQLHCMGCHAEDGMGLAGQVPPIRLTLVPLLATSAGREYVLRVPGIAQSNLSSRELADVLNWLLRDFSASSAARTVTPVTAAEVARFRGEPWLDVQGARAKLIVTR
jgi:mono/diheme cytochrome c family protein